MRQNKVILLLCFEFPPYPSIGGRRWAKFAKYLARDGYTIHVIAAQSPLGDNRQNLNWLKDIESSNIFTYYIKSHYPYKLIKNRKSIAGRLVRKLYASYLEYTGMGIVQDKAIFWQQDLLRLAKELIANHAIQNVISTGPPHRVNYYATLLKRDNSSLNIICDFRDTWLDGKVYGLKKISKRVLKVESVKEKYTVQHADKLLFTYQPMLCDFKKRYPFIPADKLNHVPHSFDKEDYTYFDKDERNREFVQFIYGGTITTSAVQDAFIPFLNAVKRLEKVNIDLYNKLRIVIYGHNAALADMILVLTLQGVVEMKDLVPEEQFYLEAAQSDFLLSLLGDDWRDFITTKNIAYLPLRKPIVLVARPGLATEFIVNNKVGYVINPDTSFDSLSLLLYKFKQGATLVDNMFDSTLFAYENVTQQLIKLLR